jgi:DNA invertase Pin-like site-specific DNA recombinase
MGRMFVTILGCIAELERSLIIERIKAGMHRRAYGLIRHRDIAGSPVWRPSEDRLR